MKQKKSQLKDDESTLRALHLRYLAKRDYTCRELMNICEEKGFAQNLIHDQLQQLMATGYINEKRFASNFTRNKKARGFGPKAIAFALNLRGISDDIIAENTKISDNSWLVEMKRLLVKRFKNDLSDPKVRVKAMRFLLNKGFTRTQVFLVLKEDDTE